MAFGIKIRNIKTKKSYSLESLYEAIKDKTFTAGEPSLTKHDVAKVITFPAVDRQNQVWILKNGFGSETSKFSVQKNKQAGAGRMAENAGSDKESGGIFGVGRAGGDAAKRCKELVDITVKELEALDL